MEIRLSTTSAQLAKCPTDQLVTALNATTRYAERTQNDVLLWKLNLAAGRISAELAKRA